jgi:hypothetical protein
MSSTNPTGVRYRSSVVEGLNVFYREAGEANGCASQEW